ncbi:MAG: glycosyltransferase [Kiritimatiellaeota bacterium]|nr:glycosyltransferase [Kiritimatiellota bacterium]
MWQCVEALRTLGPCRILSAARKPVGEGWTPEIVRKLEDDGYEVVLREKDYPHPSWRMILGFLWGAFFKSIREVRAFGHANPYHRWAFPLDWWRKHTVDADLVVIPYSFWAYLPTPCPKALLLLDLWSNTTWSNRSREAQEIAGCDLVIVISKDEEQHLHDRHILHTHWSPPAVPRCDLPRPAVAGLVGSGSAVNREGLRWLTKSAAKQSLRFRVYGGLARHTKADLFDPVGFYADEQQPYRECGVILMTTTQGMGVQIKSIEALAAGRAIVARRGAMRGMPPGDGAWLEVDTPEQMEEEAGRLVRDAAAREALGRRAHDYYDRHLDSERIRADMVGAFTELAACKHIRDAQYLAVRS